VLAPGARRPEGVDPEVFLVDLDLGLLDLGDHIHPGERSVPPRLGVEWADPDQPVNTPLRFQDAVGVIPPHSDRGGADTGLLGLQVLVDFRLETALLEVAEIHPQHHLGPVGGVHSPGAGMDTDDGGTVVVLTEEEALPLQILEIGRNGPQFRGDIGGRRLVGLLGGHLQQQFGIVQ